VKLSRSIRFATLLLATPFLGSCNINVFSPFDHATSDVQLVSAARAAFDRGDLSTAQDLYQKISDNDQDIRNSESAFLILAQQGATMANLIEFVGNGAGGTALTKFAEHLVSGSGETKRLAIYSAFSKFSSIQDTNLQNFVKFATSLALSAEILAESADSDGVLRKKDIVTDPSTCKAAVPSAACSHPSGNNLQDSHGSDIATTAPSGTNPNIDQLYYSIQTAYASLNALGANGSFGKTSSNFSTATNLSGQGYPSITTPTLELFRANLVDPTGLNLGE